MYVGGGMLCVLAEGHCVCWRRHIVRVGGGAMRKRHLVRVGGALRAASCWSERGAAASGGRLAIA